MTSRAHRLLFCFAAFLLKGKVVIQGQGVTDLSRLPSALDLLLR